MTKEHHSREGVNVTKEHHSREGVNVTKEHHKDEALTLSVEHAAHLIGVSRTTTYRMVRDGELQAVRVGRRVLVLKKPLMEMLEAEEDTSRL